MAAAGIRPQPARMILLAAALLQQEPPALIDQKDREGAMKEPLAVDRVLAGGADRAIALVDQDQLFIGHIGRRWLVARGSPTIDSRDRKPVHAFSAASFAALSLRASTRLSRLSTKRAWLPVLIWSISSLAETSNTTLRRSTAITVAVISTAEPMRVAARCLSAISIPTESSPLSQCSIRRLRQTISMSLTSRGVA